MKKVLLLTGIFLAAISQSDAQCPCRSFAELTDADIQIPRLSWKTTADFIVKIKNKGQSLCHGRCNSMAERVQRIRCQ